THNLAISDTVVSDNSGHGIVVAPTVAGQAIRIAIERAQIVNNGQDGFISAGSGGGTIDATISNTTSANNRRFGFLSTGLDTVSTVMVVRSVSANNSTGLSIGGVAKLRVGQSTIAGNTLHTWFGNGGTLQSFGDNYIAGNADGDPALPGTIAKK